MLCDVMSPYRTVPHCTGGDGGDGGGWWIIHSIASVRAVKNISFVCMSGCLDVFSRPPSFFLFPLSSLHTS